jgi:hypothetical protein
VKLVKVGERKVLDFDVENRPLSYWWGDVTTGEMTAIAWSWMDPENVEVRALGDRQPHRAKVSMRGMLDPFLEAYEQADMVVGHYIRYHDLPLVNAMLLEEGLPPLESKLTHDTKLDLMKIKHLPATQESLSDFLGVDAPKIGMSQKKWRAANRLEAIALTKERVVGDVVQNILLHRKLVELGMLRAPRRWDTRAAYKSA